MSITNTAKPITTLANASKVSNQETWDSNTSTWNTETRTWNAMVSKFTDTAKPTTSITNTAKPA